MERTRAIPRCAAVLALALAWGCYDEDDPPRRPQVQACEPADCATLGAECGEVPDGCEGVLSCGACAGGETCGAGGPNVCGEGPCTPATCASLGAGCGPAADGCGAILDCGGCPEGLACGGGGVENQCGAVCVLATCASSGAECGQVPDGCGGVLECGACPEGETCGGGGTANACGTAACTPSTCEALGAACGAIGDGCGAVLDCGGCPEGETCGGGGAANQCGVPACTPATCEALGAACGAIGDGCGGVLECGTCPEGQRCEENACVAPPPPAEAGATRWLLDLGGQGDEHVAGLAVQDDGTLVALTLAGRLRGDEKIGLVWIGPDGNPLEGRARTWDVHGTVRFGPDPIAVAPSGDVFLAVTGTCAPDGCTTFGGGPVDAGMLVKLTAAGGHLWSRRFENGVASNVAADADGGAAVASGMADAGMDPVTVWKFRPDGEPEWTWVGDDEASPALAFDPDGNVLVGQEYAATKLDPSGQPLWRDTQLAGLAWATAVAAAGDRVVVAGIHDTDLVLGTLRLPPPGDAGFGVYLAAYAAADGAPAWLRSAGEVPAWEPAALGAPADVAGHPDGWLAVLVKESGCAFRVERREAAGGEVVWARRLEAPGCAEAALLAADVELGAAGDVVVGGGFVGPVDFGAGPVEGKGGRDGFVLDLAP